MGWLDRDEFRRRFHREHDSTNVRLVETIALAATERDLRAGIAAEPTADPPDAGDPPGPILCWYGENDGAPFVLTHYLHPELSLTTLATPETKQPGRACRWHVLREVPLETMAWGRHVTWIRGAEAESTTSVFRTDEHGIRWEVYRATSDVEARDLHVYLTSCFRGEAYEVGPAEDVSGSWMVHRDLAGSPRAPVAQYTQRSSAENAARWMSLRDEALYVVSSGDGPGVGLSFRRGMRAPQSRSPTDAGRGDAGDAPEGRDDRRGPA